MRLGPICREQQKLSPSWYICSISISMNGKQLQAPWRYEHNGEWCEYLRFKVWSFGHVAKLMVFMELMIMERKVASYILRFLAEVINKVLCRVQYLSRNTPGTISKHEGCKNQINRQVESSQSFTLDKIMKKVNLFRRRITTCIFSYS